MDRDNSAPDTCISTNNDELSLGTVLRSDADADLLRQTGDLHQCGTTVSRVAGPTRTRLTRPRVLARYCNQEPARCMLKQLPAHI